MNPYLGDLVKRRDELKIEIVTTESQLIKLRTEYEATDNLIRAISPTELVRTDVLPVAPDQSRSTAFYPTKGNLFSKIMFALESLTKGSASDIEDFLRKHESTISGASITITASNMAKAGDLKIIEKEGRKNIYAIK